MAYTATYASSDLGNVIGDILASIGVALVPFATIIALVILYHFLVGRKTKLGV